MMYSSVNYSPSIERSFCVKKAARFVSPCRQLVNDAHKYRAVHYSTYHASIVSMHGPASKKAEASQLLKRLATGNFRTCLV